MSDPAADPGRPAGAGADEEPADAPRDEEAPDPVDEAEEETFPASDPASTWAGGS